MNAKFGFTSKRINSTSRQFTVIFEADITLKTNTSIVTPVFKLLGGRFPIYNDQGTIIGYNEIEPVTFDKVKNCNYIEYNGSYYWINDIISENNYVSSFICSRDVLATFLPNIRKTNAYVEYGPKSLYDNKGYLDDIRFSPDIESENSYGVNLSTDLFEINATDDCMVVWTVCSVTGNVTDVGTVTLCSSLATFYKCCLTWSKAYIDDQDGVLEGTARYLYRMTSGTFEENVYNAKLYPINYNTFVTKYSGSFRTFNGSVGPYNITNGLSESERPKIIDYVGPFYSFKNSSGSDAKFKLPTNPSIDPSSKYAFLKGEKYKEIILMTPSGTHPISSNKFIMSDVDWDFSYEYYFDIRTGEVTLALKKYGANIGEIYDITSWNIGTDITHLATSGASVQEKMVSSQLKMAEQGFSIASSVLSGIGALTGAGSEAMYITAEKTLDSGNIAKAERQLNVATALEYASPVANDISSKASTMSSGIGMIMPSTGCRSSSVSNTNANGLMGIWINSFTGTYMGPMARISVNNYLPSIFSDWSYNDYLNGTDKYQEFCNKYGYPVMNLVDLEDVYGYVKCANANVITGIIQNGESSADFNAITLQEASSVNSLLNSGIYIED